MISDGEKREATSPLKSTFHKSVLCDLCVSVVEDKRGPASMIADWETFVARHSGRAEFDLGIVQPGDTLRVVTDHTDYVFEIVEGSEAQLRCSRPDRPTGRVRISGCGFAFSTTFKPGRLFCGGRLEFTFLRDDIPARYRTTSINAIVHSHRGEREGESDSF